MPEKWENIEDNSRLSGLIDEDSRGLISMDLFTDYILPLLELLGVTDKKEQFEIFKYFRPGVDRALAKGLQCSYLFKLEYEVPDPNRIVH